MKKFLKLIGLTFFLSGPLPVLAHLAHAESVCGDSKTVFKNLEKKFGESPTGAGISDNGDLVTVFSSESGTFTIVVTSPQGKSCVRSSGNDWMGTPPKGRES